MNHGFPQDASPLTNPAADVTGLWVPHLFSGFHGLLQGWGGQCCPQGPGSPWVVVVLYSGESNAVGGPHSIQPGGYPGGYMISVPECLTAPKLDIPNVEIPFHCAKLSLILAVRACKSTKQKSLNNYFISTQSYNSYVSKNAIVP